MKNLINILMAAGAVVLVGIIVVLLFIFGVLPPGQKTADAPPPDPEPTRAATSSPAPTTSSAPPSTTPPPPAPSPSPEPTAAGIPGGGGEVRLEFADVIEFTPASTGVWVLRTYDNGDDDPNITVLDSSGSQIAFDDDSDPHYNAFLMLLLEAGSTYSIRVAFYTGFEGTCMLSVQPAEVLPGDGSESRVRGTAAFAFTPNASGTWAIFTTENDGDPYLSLYSASGDYITSDDDGGDGYNALLIVDLNAGETYCIQAKNYGYTDDAFTLIVVQYDDTLGDVDEYDPNVESVRMEAPFEIPFTPDEDGVWIFYTSQNGSTDPMLSIFGPDDSLISEDDDGWGGLNSLLVVYLIGGETYLIKCDLWGGSTGEVTLSAKAPSKVITFEGYYGVNNITVFEFYPERSGTYVFETMDSEPHDPMIDVYDDNADFIDGDDDGAGGRDALLSIYLEAGEVYHIIVSFYDGGAGSCLLQVTPP